jgi:hypothetical protein
MMGTTDDRADEARQDDVGEPAGGRAEGREVPLQPWAEAKVRLVADHTRGSTHKFFGDWRFEVIGGAGQAAPSTTPFAVPLDLRELAAAGWRYDFRLEEDLPGPAGGGRAAFSWRATTDPGTPDPLAAALGQAEAWLVGHGWEQDPSTPAPDHG